MYTIVAFLNGATQISNQLYGIDANQNAGGNTLKTESAPTAFSCLDTSVNGVPGTYTYKIQALAFSPSGSGTARVAFTNVILTAYEI